MMAPLLLDIDPVDSASACYWCIGAGVAALIVFGLIVRRRWRHLKPKLFPESETEIANKKSESDGAPPIDAADVNRILMGARAVCEGETPPLTEAVARAEPHLQALAAAAVPAVRRALQSASLDSVLMQQGKEFFYLVVFPNRHEHAHLLRRHSAFAAGLARHLSQMRTALANRGQFSSLLTYLLFLNQDSQGYFLLVSYADSERLILPEGLVGREELNEPGVSIYPESDQSAAGITRASSPVLRFFETNPFRSFRLPVTASTTEAACAAENVLTLSRLEIPPDEPDPMPWLAAPDTFELQQAAQAVEEPYVRLRAQLLWFDTERDIHGAELKEALHTPSSEALSRYLATDHHSVADAAPPSLPGAESGATANGVAAMVAQKINQANLRLLLAGAENNSAMAQPHGPIVESKLLTDKEWKTAGGARILEGAHGRVAAWGTGANDQDGERRWRHGLVRWNALLAGADFRQYLAECIEQLQDDFVTADDVETVAESVRVFLADLSAQEIRHLVLDGRYLLAAELIGDVANSTFDAAILRPAMRPLASVFQAELVEIEPLLNAPNGDEIAAVESFITRVTAVRERWRTIDRAGLIGLLDLLDQSIERAFAQLRSQEKTAPRLEEIAGKLIAVASAESLQERIKTFRTQIVEDRKRFCHFCKKERPDYDRSVVLRGQKVTGVTRSGNTTTTHYAIRWAIVMRCGRCAKFHDFVSACAIWPTVIISVLFAALAYCYFAL